MSEVSNPIKEIVGSMLDFFHAVGDSAVFQPVVEAYTNVRDFLDLFSVVSDVPNLIYNFLWSPIGICMVVVVFSSLVSKLLGVVR